MSSTLNELKAVNTYIYEQLLAQGGGLTALVNTTGGFFKAFAGPAPRDCATKDEDDIITVETVEPPFIIWELVDNKDVNALGRTRIFSRPIVVVRAVTRSSSFDSAAAIANYIDAALHNSPTDEPISGTLVMGFDRQSVVQVAEVVNGVRWNYVGATYRGFVCRAP